MGVPPAPPLRLAAGPAVRATTAPLGLCPSPCVPRARTGACEGPPSHLHVPLSVPHPTDAPVHSVKQQFCVLLVCVVCLAPGNPSPASAVACTACPAGQYNPNSGGTSLSACTPCPAGTYGVSLGLTSPGCSGFCKAGSYGGPGQTSNSCSGSCLAGYACPVGSTSPTQAQCVPGKYSSGGAAVCSNCKSGSYGDQFGDTTSSCSGPCAAGYACPAGSTSATQVLCGTGTYTPLGSATCQPCAPGLYGSSTALSSANCTGQCPLGRHVQLADCLSGVGGAFAPVACVVRRGWASPTLVPSLHSDARPWRLQGSHGKGRVARAGGKLTTLTRPVFSPVCGVCGVCGAWVSLCVWDMQVRCHRGHG
jgi:hypothetical protein